MERYIKIIKPNGVSEQRTRFTYETGDAFLLNNKTPCKCIEVLKEDDKEIYVFKAAKIKYDYNW